MRRTREINLRGQVFGRLSVKRKVGSCRQGVKWECLCDCGNTKVVTAGRLRCGWTRSCGCLMRELTSKRNRERPPPKSKLPDGLSAFNKLICRYRRSADVKGLEWSLTKRECYDLFDGDCFYCGAEPHRTATTQCGAARLYNGIDRMDNEQGYTYENTVSCCRYCNIAKNSMKFSTWRKWVSRLSKNYKSTRGWRD